MVISRISMIRPGLPILFPSETVFSAELRVTVKTSFVGVPVTGMVAAIAVVCTRGVIRVSGTVVGLMVCDSVVIVGELLCGVVWDCADIHPELTIPAVSMMINTEQITKLFFTVIDIRLKSHLW